MRGLLLLLGLALGGMVAPERTALAQAPAADTVRTAAPTDALQRVRQRIGTLRGRRVRQIVQPVYIIVPTPAETGGTSGAAAPVPRPAERQDEAPVVSRGILPGTLLPSPAPAGASIRPDSAAPASPAPRLDAPRVPVQPAPLPPAQIAPAPLVREVERVLLDVGLLRAVGLHFAFGQATLFAGEDRTLDAVGDVLQRHPDLRLAIGGHTDAVGSEAFNQRLSEARAATVRRYLVERWNVDPARLTAQGYGEGVPVAPNGNETGRALNRRVEFRVVE